MNNVATTSTTIEPGGCIRGSFRVPGDKSISHRYALLASIANGATTINGYAPGADCDSTLHCLKQLGVDIVSESDNQTVIVQGVGLDGLQAAKSPLNCGNSGTTMRLLAGILSAQDFESTLIGDSSLENRPMLRVIQPLSRMGALINATEGHSPLNVIGKQLRGIKFKPTVASAQVKSAILLAGLYAEGETWIHESEPTRDHTERALPVFGVALSQKSGAVGVRSKQPLQAATTLNVPGDFSSATYWLVAAAALPGSTIEICGLGLNPTRTRLLNVLRAAGAYVNITHTETFAGEPEGTVTVSHRELKPITVTSSDVPQLIDELPALAALAAHGGGLRVSGATELRAKESDRISVLVDGLQQLGIQAKEFPDGFHVHGDNAPTGGTANACGDHRMAMAFTVAALGATGSTTIVGHDVVKISYPDFFDTLKTIRYK